PDGQRPLASAVDGAPHLPSASALARARRRWRRSACVVFRARAESTIRRAGPAPRPARSAPPPPLRPAVVPGPEDQNRRGVRDPRGAARQSDDARRPPSRTASSAHGRSAWGGRAPRAEPLATPNAAALLPSRRRGPFPSSRERRSLLGHTDPT